MNSKFSHFGDGASDREEEVEDGAPVAADTDLTVLEFGVTGLVVAGLVVAVVCRVRWQPTSV